MTTILIIGGADTGRAPMAAALLRRLSAARGYRWTIESAGVLGHDGDEAEPEARDAMEALGLDISAHQARSLTEPAAAQATLLIAVERGVALVVSSRFPHTRANTHILGELAQRARDIPDPFRMQLGAWMTYAREIEALLIAALPQIATLVAEPTESPIPIAESPAETTTRNAAIKRIGTLIHMLGEMPDVIDWSAARLRIETDLDTIATSPLAATDLVNAYVGLLRAALALSSSPPSIGQRTAFHKAIEHLTNPIAQSDLNTFSAQLARWGTI